MTGEVIFPLPPIHVGYLMESQWNLPEDADRDNLVNSRPPSMASRWQSASTGSPCSNRRGRKARPLAYQYDTPGRDVTADLARLGIPLSLDLAEVVDALAALTPEQQAEATALGLAEFSTKTYHLPASGRSSCAITGPRPFRPGQW